MAMKWICVLATLLSLTVAAQTPRTKAPTRASLAAELEAEKSKNTDLIKKNAELEAKVIEMKATIAVAENVIASMKQSGDKIIDYTTALQTEYQKAVSSHNDLVVKYNALVNQADYMRQVINNNNRLADEQRRLNNALLLYSILPKYQPQPPPPPQRSINCLSTFSPGTMLTTCN